MVLPSLDIGNYSTIGKVGRGPAKKYLIQVVWQSNDVLYIKSSLNHVISIPDDTEEEVAPELPISVVLNIFKVTMR